ARGLHFGGDEFGRQHFVFFLRFRFFMRRFRGRGGPEFLVGARRFSLPVFGHDSEVVGGAREQTAERRGLFDAAPPRARRGRTGDRGAVGGRRPVFEAAARRFAVRVDEALEGRGGLPDAGGRKRFRGRRGRRFERRERQRGAFARLAFGVFVEQLELVRRGGQQARHGRRNRHGGFAAARRGRARDGFAGREFGAVFELAGFGFLALRVDRAVERRAERPDFARRLGFRDGGARERKFDFGPGLLAFPGPGLGEEPEVVALPGRQAADFDRLGDPFFFFSGRGRAGHRFHTGAAERFARFGVLEAAFRQAARRVDFGFERQRRAFRRRRFAADFRRHDRDFFADFDQRRREIVAVDSLDHVEGAFAGELVFNQRRVLLALAHVLRDAGFEFPFGAERVGLRDLRRQRDGVGDRERGEFRPARFGGWFRRRALRAVFGFAFRPELEHLGVFPGDRVPPLVHEHVSFFAFVGFVAGDERGAEVARVGLVDRALFGRAAPASPAGPADLLKAGVEDQHRPVFEAAFAEVFHDRVHVQVAFGPERHLPAGVGPRFDPGQLFEEGAGFHALPFFLFALEFPTFDFARHPHGSLRRGGRVEGGGQFDDFEDVVAHHEDLARARDDR